MGFKDQEDADQMVKIGFIVALSSEIAVKIESTIEIKTTTADRSNMPIVWQGQSQCKKMDEYHKHQLKIFRRNIVLQLRRFNTLKTGNKLSSYEKLFRAESRRSGINLNHEWIENEISESITDESENEETNAFEGKFDQR